MEILFTSIFLYIIYLCCCCAVDLEQDLKTMAQMLPGMYSNNIRHASTHKTFGLEDSQLYPESPVPVDTLSTMPVNAMYRPVNVTFLPHSFNVYVEQTVYGQKQPHRQWLYSFSVDSRSRAIKHKMYNFLDTSLKEKISKTPRALMYLSARDVTTRTECDMLWRKLGSRFIGATTKRCVGLLDDKQVQISVIMTLTTASLQIDEGWYNVHDGSKLTELDGPILLTKTEAIAVNPFLHPEQEEPAATHHSDKGEKPGTLLSDGRMKRHKSVALTRNHIPDPQRHVVKSGLYSHKRTQLSRYSSNKVPEVKTDKKRYHDVGDKFTYKHDKVLNTIIRKAGFKNKVKQTDNSLSRHEGPNSKRVVVNSKTKSTWNLQSYSGVLDALINGHKVYFTARTKRCIHQGVPVKERSMFGDYVQMFEIGNDFSDKQPYTHLSFSYKRMEQSRGGFHEVVKHLVVHRNGTVHIAAVYVNEDGQVDRQTFTICSMYEQDKGKGDVRFYLDPYRDVAPLPRFKSLRSALQKGKMVRLTTDLDKCSGGKTDHVIIGGELRSYDLGRNGRAIDVTLSLPRIIISPENRMSLEEDYYIFKFYKQGETTLVRHSKTMTSQSQNFSIVTGYLKYKCEIDSNSSTKAISLYNS